MVKLRTLGGEFHSPEEIKEGALLTMDYLDDMRAYQEYQDGDLTRLFERKKGNTNTQRVTGSHIYKNADIEAYMKLNIFMSVLRYVIATVFEQNPAPIEGDDTIKAKWNLVENSFLVAGIAATGWQVSKGRQVYNLAVRFPNQPILLAVDPQHYLPLVDLIDREIKIGDVIFHLYRTQPRQPHNNIPDHAAFQISVTEEQAALSDGRATVMNQRRVFPWGGDNARGTLGAEESRETNARSLRIWSFGDDDSIFASVESNVYELILAFTNARTALTQDVRSRALVPKLLLGQELDPLDPVYEAPLSATSSDIYKYFVPPGPAMAEAFLSFINMLLDMMAYTANIPREAFGLNMMANESGEALNKLQQIFKTTVIDIRTNISRIFSEAFSLIYPEHPDVIIGWVDEPFANTVEKENRIINGWKESIIPHTQEGLDFVLAQLGWPQMTFQEPQPATQEDPNALSQRNQGGDA